MMTPHKRGIRVASVAVGRQAAWCCGCVGFAMATPPEDAVATRSPSPAAPQHLRGWSSDQHSRLLCLRYPLAGVWPTKHALETNGGCQWRCGDGVGKGQARSGIKVVRIMVRQSPLITPGDMDAPARIQEGRAAAWRRAGGLAVISSHGFHF